MSGWIGVRKRFARFNSELIVTDDQRNDANMKQLGARKALQAHYYGQATDSPPGLVVGSWGKRTNRRPPADIDVFFFMPLQEFARFEALASQKQSALLQEVKGILSDKYFQSDMRGDGQVVQMLFNSITVELVPVFAFPGGWLMPHTANGGTWRKVDPIAEFQEVDSADTASAGNARRLMRMMKCWRDHSHVPLKSFVLERLVGAFIATYQYRDQSYFWFDWFCRDFFEFLQICANKHFFMPGTGDRIEIGDAWLSRAVSAYERSLRACEYEYHDLTEEAGQEWQKIFGGLIPIHNVT
jgi:hypothetical protein